MNNSLAFTGSNPQGYKAEIRKAADGYSVFTWFDTDKTGPILWREKHELSWLIAFNTAIAWLKTSDGL